MPVRMNRPRQRARMTAWDDSPPTRARPTGSSSPCGPAPRLHPALRWQPPERWHSTLAFLGPADPARATARIDRIPLAPARPVRLAGTGTFGPVLWIGVQHDGWLADLAQSVQQALRVVDGPYHPHVTIARGRGPEATTAAHGAAHALAGYRGPPWLPPAVTLVRSRTGPRPLYEVLSTWPLSPG